MSRGVGIFGGTFDPIHYGHLRVADEVRIALELAEVRMMPAGNPYHRSNVVATAQQRLAMARLGVAEFPGLTVDGRELWNHPLAEAVTTPASLDVAQQKPECAQQEEAA